MHVGTGMPHAEGASWAAGQTLEACGRHGTLCPRPVASAKTPTQLNFVHNWLSNAGSAGGTAWVWSSATEIAASGKTRAQTFTKHWKKHRTGLKTHCLLLLVRRGI